MPPKGFLKTAPSTPPLHLLDMDQNIYPVIGISPGNSYFTDEVIEQLLKEVVKRYTRTAVLIADTPAISTYIALGYPENRARRDKALPKGNNLRNKTFKAAQKLNYSSEQVRIIHWETEIENNCGYQEEYSQILKLYTLNQSFQKAADSATAEVLEGFGRKISDLNASTKIAVHYLLAEFAFMEFAPRYFGVRSVAYIYHKNWPIYEKHIAGEFDNHPKPYLKFVIIEIEP